MKEKVKCSTVYFDPKLHRALHLKAAETRHSLSDLVNDAVRALLSEDAEDLSAFAKRAAEPVLTYEELPKDLKARGKIWAGLQEIRGQGFAWYSGKGHRPPSPMFPGPG